MPLPKKTIVPICTICTLATNKIGRRPACFFNGKVRLNQHNSDDGTALLVAHMIHLWNFQTSGTCSGPAGLSGKKPNADLARPLISAPVSGGNTNKPHSQYSRRILTCLEGVKSKRRYQEGRELRKALAPFSYIEEASVGG